MAQVPAYTQGYGTRGVKWPWSATGPQAATDRELTESQVKMVVFTPVGSHKMEPGFASTINSIVFENRGMPLKSLASIVIRNAFETWLPSIRLLSVEIKEEQSVEGLVTIDVGFEYLGQQGTVTGTIVSYQG